MNILSFRIFISLLLIVMMFFKTASFFLHKKPISKMADLASIYLLNATFLLYMIVIKNLENTFFSIFIIIFIDFLVTFATGIGILNNILNAGKRK